MVRQIGKLILFATTLCAQDYYLTYKLYTQDLSIYNESVQISRAMVAPKGSPKEYLFFATSQESVDAIITHEKQRIVDTVLSHRATVYSQTDVQNYQASTSTYLKIYPQRIKVEFNNGLAKIGLYKN